MGWYPIVKQNTLLDALTEDFWQDLSKEVDRRFNLKEHKDGDYVPDCFMSADIDDLKFSAFDSDHMEHIGSWVFDQSLWSLFKKHKITGAFVLDHSDGDGGYSGIWFENGVPYDVDVECVIVKGARLKKDKV